MSKIKFGDFKKGEKRMLYFVNGNRVFRKLFKVGDTSDKYLTLLALDTKTEKPILSYSGTHIGTSISLSHMNSSFIPNLYYSCGGRFPCFTMEVDARQYIMASLNEKKRELNRKIMEAQLSFLKNDKGDYSIMNRKKK